MPGTTINPKGIGKKIMNIFSSLRSYAGKWSVKDSRNFTAEEIGEVSAATVIASKEGYGNSVCFLMKSGVQHFIPLSNNSTLGVGDSVDLGRAKLLTLQRAGEADILRVSI